MVICERGFGALLFPCIPTDWPLSRYGYGERYVKGSCLVSYTPDRKVTYRTERAHVEALIRKLGRPRLPGMQANHHCDNRACIQEAHLYEGTQVQNVEDMWDRKRGWSPFANGIKGTPRKLSPEEEAAMRRRYAAGGVTMDNLAGEYGVCKATVSAIVRDRAPHAPLKRLSGAQRDEIRQRYAAGGIKQRDLAAEYGVTNGTISNVITRRFKDPRT